MAAVNAVSPDQATTVWPMVRVRFHRSARYPAGTVISPLTIVYAVSRIPICRSPIPKSCFNGVTTPRRMFWSTWSMKMTRPSTHIGHTEMCGFAAADGDGLSSGASADVGVIPSVPGSGMSSCSDGWTASVVTTKSPVSALDGHAHERSVFGPRAVVVLDGLVAEQLGEHEPRVRRALADAAVGDHLLLRRHARVFVQRLQLVSGLERAVLVGCPAPRDVRRARDVPAHLRLLLWEVRRRQQLAPILLGRPHVDELHLADLLQDLIP